MYLKKKVLDDLNYYKSERSNMLKVKFTKSRDTSINLDGIINELAKLKSKLDERK